MLSCFAAKSDKTKADVEASKVSTTIEATIKAERQELANLQTILLLGTGNAGKSTFAKQVCFLLGSKQNHDDYKEDLKNNTLDSLKAFLRACEKEHVTIEGFSQDQINDLLRETFLTLKVAKAIETLYKSAQVKKLMEDVAERDLALISGVDGAHYFFANVMKFIDDAYSPTLTDALKIRRKTSGVLQYNFTISNSEQFVNKELQLRLIDVGGQQGERRKWLQFFRDVDFIIFLVAINEYDMVVEEDRTKNRLMDTLGLWFQLTGHPNLVNKPWILFLNKSDLFQKKIAAVPLDSLFSNWETFASNPEVKKTQFG